MTIKPSFFYSNIGGRLAGKLTKLAPSLFWNRFDSHANQLGIENLSVILSFDCDRDQDIAAAEELFKKYQNKIKITLSVPGEQLRHGSDIYRRLANNGVVFMNHGEKPHAVLLDGIYVSRTFYHKMSNEEIKKDIHQADQTVTKITGKKPIGFRTPHFGLYQSPDQLDSIHNILQSLNYQYSSSSNPIYGWTHGPAWINRNILECPLAGLPNSPLTVFDSWSYVLNPKDSLVGEKYGEALISALEFHKKRGTKGVLCFYADPSHVIQSESYHKALSWIINNEVTTLTYEDLVTIIRKKSP